MAEVVSDLHIPYIQVTMTLAEEAYDVNPIGGSGFRFTGVGQNIESALRLCKLQQEGMINASAQFLQSLENVGQCAIPPSYRPLSVSDFILRFGLDCRVESPLEPQKPVQELAYAVP